MQDFALVDHGSIAMLTPRTKAAREWIANNLPDDAPRMGNGVAIEPRYVLPILDGIDAEGLTFIQY